MAKPTTPPPILPRPAKPARKRPGQPLRLSPAAQQTLVAAVITFCGVVLLVCLYRGVGAVQSMLTVRQIVSQQQAAVKAVKPDADQAQATYRALVGEQESNRAHYSGPEAMEMSDKVMNAKSQADELGQQLKQAQTALDDMTEVHRRTSLEVVPLLGVFLTTALVLTLVLVANPRIRKPRRTAE